MHYIILPATSGIRLRSLSKILGSSFVDGKTWGEDTRQKMISQVLQQRLVNQ